jgi:hypothetical protein
MTHLDGDYSSLSFGLEGAGRRAGRFRRRRTGFPYVAVKLRRALHGPPAAAAGPMNAMYGRMPERAARKNMEIRRFARGSLNLVRRSLGLRDLK